MSFEEIVPNDRLRQARRERGWTQAKVAELVSSTTSFETVSRWERGIKIPSAYYRRRLCEIFDKTAQELGLFTGPPTFPTSDSSPHVFLSSAYTDAEHKFVVSLKGELQSRGITFWSSRTIKRQESGNKRNALQGAVRAVQVVLLIVSPRTPASHHVHDTLQLARHYDRPVCALWIDGKSLQECMPRGYGEPYATIDARKGDDQLLRNKVVEALEKPLIAPDSPAAPGLTGPIWKVPTIPTPLIGRDEEMERLSELLESSQVRFVSLLGPGGIGKTHLSLQVAMDLRESFTDGVCFVSLAAINDPKLVLPAIAKELGIREIKQMTATLNNKHLLLLLDNFEQVVAAAIELPGLLAECPNLKILVTSRATLHAQGEYEFFVPPLVLPDLTQPLESDALTQNPAVALFLQHTQASKPGFHITSANARTIAEICVRLDGLPLAIELAAARMRSVASQELLARLVKRLLDVVVSKDQSKVDRQRTLRNTITWSYNLLDSEERQLFRRLSVFAGGWNVETMEAVYHAMGDSASQVWDGMESLLDKSLLLLAEREGEGRLRLLETIREYGLELLEASGEAEITRQAHAEYYLRLVEEAEPYLKGKEQALWLTRLEQEQGNLRAALGWLCAHGDVELALRFCGAMWWFWRLRGYWGEGRRWLETALELPQTGEQSVALVRALWSAGDLAYYQDGFPLARSLLEKSITLGRALAADKELAMALITLGVFLYLQGEDTGARPLLEEGEKICRKLGSIWEVAYLLRKLGEYASRTGELKRAAEYAEESLTLAQKLGDKSLIATTLSTLGSLAALQDNLTQAIAYNQEVLTITRELGDKLLVALALNNLGYFMALKGDPTLLSYAQESYTLSRELGDRMYICKTLHTLGYITAHQGNLTQARIWYHESLSMAQEIKNEKGTGMSLWGLAMIAVVEGQLLQAARLLGAVEARLNIEVDMNNAERTEYKRTVASAREQLGGKTFVAARDAGRTMTLEQILAVLRSTAPENPPPSPTYPDGLTEREVQVLCLVARGLTDEQIARQLVIARRTVNTHLTSIYRKIQVTSYWKEKQFAPRVAATLYATERDLC